jgi:hypothetical protein
MQVHYEVRLHTFLTGKMQKTKIGGSHEIANNSQHSFDAHNGHISIQLAPRDKLPITRGMCRAHGSCKLQDRIGISRHIRTGKDAKRILRTNRISHLE